MSDEVAEWCGYGSTWDMLTYHLDKEELMNLLQEFVYEDKQGWIAEIIEDLAKQIDKSFDSNWEDITVDVEEDR